MNENVSMVLVVDPAPILWQTTVLNWYIYAGNIWSRVLVLAFAYSNDMDTVLV